MKFSRDFIWGAATSSYQIEGAVNEDGRCPSIWDTYTHKEHITHDGKNGDITCDHYHRYKEDIALMRELGINAYRFSIAWPRLFSYSTSNKKLTATPNEKGFDFYDRLIDELLKNNIEPWITLYHWDMPETLQNGGGFLTREIADWGAEYAAAVSKRYSDRVTHYFTLNEMPCILGGYMGWKAPGLVKKRKDHLNVIHNMLLTHGKMNQALRAASTQKIIVSCAQNGLGNYPATDSKEDYEAFLKAMNCIEGAPYEYSPLPGSKRIMSDALIYYLDPIHFGKYPEQAFNIFKGDMPKIKDGDMELISTPTEIQGINIYEGRPIASGSKGKYQDGWHIADYPDGMDRNAAKWPITPESMNKYFNFISDRYKKPIYITENGMSNADLISEDGKCHDPQRIEFMRRYLEKLSTSIENGADVRGYFHWSLLDNFEWENGFNERFGLVHIDYTTQKRTPKDSFYWYKDLIKKFR